MYARRAPSGVPGGLPDRPPSSLRIALLLHLAPRKLGSIEAWLIALAERLAERGHSVTVFTREPVHRGVADTLGRAGVSRESIDRLRESPLRGAMRLRQFDVIHLSFVSPLGRIAVMSYCAWPARVLFVDHNSRRKTELMTRLGIRQHRAPTGVRRLFLASLARRRLTGVAGVSKYVSKQAEAELELPARKVTAIHNGVDLERFRPPVAARPAPPPFVILSVAHLIPAKGIEYLLRAAALLSEERAELIVVGDGADRDRLETLARSLGIAERTCFSGLRDDVEDLLRRATVFVHPAIWGEAFGLTVAEALASGCPVVASDVGAIPELIENGINGLLVPPADPEALAAALRSLFESRELRERLGQAGRQCALDRFGLERSVEAHVRWCEGAVP